MSGAFGGSPRNSGGSGHVRSKSSGGKLGSPAVRRSAGSKSPAAPVVADVKAVGRAYQKATETATTKLREVWHKISELGVDKKKYPESVVRELTTALDVFVAQVQSNHDDILKAVRLAKDAAGAMATVADPEKNDTTTVDLPTHGPLLTAEQRMYEQRMSNSSAAPPPARSTSPRLGGERTPSKASPKGSPKASRRPAASSATRPLSAGNARASKEPLPTRAASDSALGGDSSSDNDNDEDEDEQERKAMETLERLRAAAKLKKEKQQQQHDASANGQGTNGSLSDSGGGEGGKEAKSALRERSKSTPKDPSPLQGTPPAAARQSPGDGGNVVRVTSESGSSEIVAEEDSARAMGDDGFLRRKTSLEDAVDAATEALRKKKAAKRRAKERFLHDCDALDEAAVKEQAARRAAALQKNPWAAVRKAVRQGSLSEAPPDDDGK